MTAPTNATRGLYIDFSIPLGLYSLIQQVIVNTQGDPNIPQVTVPPANRVWFSQPRPGNDPTLEVLTINFKLPLSISEVGWEAIRVGSHSEIWYQDRQNNWRRVLDEARNPVALELSPSNTAAWYKAHFYCYPIVAKALQWRIARVFDPAVGTQPYVVGVRNGLIRRNIYTRSDGTQGIEPQQDAIGNTFSSYIKDWDAAKAFDNDPHTYWKSMAFPDPQAVTSLYLDVRDPGGNAQLIDTVYLDPVYSGPMLNLYYSNDDTTATLKLSPVTAVPTTDENTTWTLGTGRYDSSTVGGTSDYQFPFAWGPLVRRDAWIGIEWIPDFDPTSGPPENPILFEVTPVAPTGGQFVPKVFYDVGGGEIVLELTDGTVTRTYTCALSPLITQNAPVRILAGWSYNPDTVLVTVVAPNGTVLGTYSATPTDLPAQVSFDGQMGFHDFRGLFTAHVVKLENYAVGQASFVANPQMYVSPDPVRPATNGTVPATTLDNAIYAAAWALQQHGTGGSHATNFSEKTWTPIWCNYTATKGRLYLPQQIAMKYLQLEFTNLIEEPYPVYDAGIQTTYHTFPISVTQTATQKHPGIIPGLLTLGADVVLSGIGSVNYLNPQTVNNAINSIWGQTINPISVTTGTGFNTSTLPNTTDLDLAGQTSQEVSSPWVYRRTPTNPLTLAANMLNSISVANVLQSTQQQVGSGIFALQQVVTNIGVLGTAALGLALSPGVLFTEALNFAANPTTLPVIGSDWWVFPGGNLRLPAAVMNGLTGLAQTIFGRAPTTETRLRFATTCVHRYDVKTLNRDAAVAYFAGVREVQPMVTTYIAALDPPAFSFSSYDPSQFVCTNTRALTSGPTTTGGSLYQVLNPGFDGSIDHWTAAQGDWVFDGTHGHWYRGTASVVADGTEKALHSTVLDVAPGAHLDASIWVSWAGLAATSGSHALQLQALYYLDGVYVSNQTAFLSYSPWAADTPVISGNNWAHIVASVGTSNQFVVPGGVNQMRLALVVTADVTAGQVWFDTVETGTTDAVEATIFKDFQTTSTFTKVNCFFTDSGLVRSDAMWARTDPLDTNISGTALAYYTSTIPDVIPAGMWGDTFATWADPVITWGEPRAVVAINVDPNRTFQGKRVLHFTRAGGPSVAGIKVRQITNFVANGLFRIGCVFYKPTANVNQISLTLRRVSDGVYIPPTPDGYITFDPVVGYWYEHVTEFFEIPDSEDQVYTVELVCSGDDPDELYLNDLYVEIAGIRYFMRLGGGGAFLHEVTALRYADSAIVTTTTPVNEFSVQLAIMSPHAYAYGMTAAPVYLK